MSNTIQITDMPTSGPKEMRVVSIPQQQPKPPAEPKPQSEKKKGGPGRYSNAQRIQAQIDADAAARRAEQEAKRAPRYQPDTRFSLAVALIIAAVALATSFTVSYSMIVATASWMRLPWEPLAWVVPGFIELLIVFATLDYIITRSRGHKAGARAPFYAMWVLSGVAVVGGTAHTISEWGAQFGPQQWESIVGTVLSAAAPLVVIYVSKRISALVFVDPERDA
jgi:hypothetical protein